MNILLLNDTSHYHNGCVAVMETIRRKLSRYVLVDSYEEADAIVINGEGTMHHGGGSKFMEVLNRAVIDRKRTYLINTVWASMPEAWRYLLHSFSQIYTRETLSQKEITAFGTDAIVYLDQSYYADIPDGDFRDFKGETATGDYFQHTAPCDLHLKRDSWGYIVRSLRTASLYITGRHHGVYAACKARCPFVAYKHNCHKIEGLLVTAGVKIPIPQSPREIDSAIKWAGRNKSAYDDLFDFMESYPDWDGTLPPYLRAAAKYVDPKIKSRSMEEISSLSIFPPVKMHGLRGLIEGERLNNPLSLVRLTQDEWATRVAEFKQGDKSERDVRIPTPTVLDGVIHGIKHGNRRIQVLKKQGYTHVDCEYDQMAIRRHMTRANKTRYRVLKGGHIGFPVSGKPPMCPEGYEPTGNAFIFRRTFEPCCHRELIAGCIDCAGNQSPQYQCKHYNLTVNREECHACELTT